MYESNGFGRQVVAELEDALLPTRRQSDRVRVLGHRGCPTAPGRPENSATAVTEALRQGADGVEVDIRLTADGALVCAHEPFALTRTGTRQDVTASASGELLGADGRSPVATLDELLAAAQRPLGSRIVVEAKPVTNAARAARTAHALADVLAAAGTADVTISSFDRALLAVIRRTCADLPVRTALLGDKAESPAAVVRRAHVDGHDEVHLPLVGVRRTPGAIRAARRLGLSVTLWTVNGSRDLRWAAGLGVDAVITDDVPRARVELDRAAAGRLTGAVALAGA